MEWIERMNRAIAYLEEHLTENVDYEALGRMACCSAYHFQRMFGYMTEMSLGEYIRRRRMSRAAAELMGGARVLDVALKYGYNSPTAFTRAFQQVMGIVPSQVREPGVQIRSFPPIAFRITVKGGIPMEYRVEKKEAIRLLSGGSTAICHDLEKNFVTIPALWARVHQTGITAQLLKCMDQPPMGVLGVCMCMGAEESWRYHIAVASGAPADGLEELILPPHTWAIFPGRGGKEAIQSLEQRIVTDWLPTSGYEYADGPDIEVYLDPDPKDGQFEIWIPVTQKQE